MGEENSNTSEPVGNEPSTNEPSFYFADGIAGSGEKPEWFIDSKYKTVSEQAKGYNEIRKQLGGFTGAPEAYEHFTPEGFELNPDEPMLESAREWAKSQNMNQEAFNGLVGLYAEIEAGKQKALEEFAQGQIAQIENFDARSQNINDFLSANDLGALADVIGTKDQLEQFEKLLDMAGKGTIDPNAEPDNIPSQEEIDRLMFEKDEFGQRIYNKDPERRARVQKMIAARVGKGDGRIMIGAS